MHKKMKVPMGTFMLNNKKSPSHSHKHYMQYYRK